MIKPEPSKQVCAQCGWKKILAPDSDALCLAEDMPEPACPKCGGPLVYKALSPLDHFALQKLLLKKRSRFKL